MAQIIHIQAFRLTGVPQRLTAWPLRLLTGSPQVWAGRCWAVMILATIEPDTITGWHTVGDKRRGECPRTTDADDRYCWLGLPPDSRIYAFYAAGAIIVICFGLFLYLRRKIDVHDLRSVKLVGLALLQVLIGVGWEFGTATLEMKTGISPSSIIGHVASFVGLWLIISGIARFLLLLRNPAKAAR